MSVEHDISVTSAAIAHHARVSSAIEQQHIGFSVRSSHAEMVDPAVKVMTMSNLSVSAAGVMCTRGSHG
jgi:hypothetical protein